MPKFIASVLSSATFRQSSLTSVSTIINGFLGAAFYFLLARFLGSSAFGAFSVSVALIILLSSVLNFGTDQAIVKFVPKYPTDFHPYAKLAFLIKLCSGILVSLALAPFMPLVGIGVLFQLLFSYSTSLAQAMEKFRLWSGLFIGTNFFRLTIAGLLIIFGGLNYQSALILYILIPLVGFIISLPFLPRIIYSAKVTRAHIGDFLHFNKWVTGMVVLSAISSRLDTLITAGQIGFAAAGIYSLANQVVVILPQLTSALGAVTSPKFASFTTNSQNKIYTGKASLFSGALAIVAGVLLLPAGLVVFSFAGIEYLDSIMPFILLLLGMAVFLATAPIRDSIMYYYSHPSYFFFISLAQLLYVAVLTPILISSYGIVGSALVVLTSQILIAVSSFGIYLHLSKTHE